MTCSPPPTRFLISSNLRIAHIVPQKRVDMVQQLVTLYVSARAISTVHDVEQYVCLELGAESFDKLVVGTILRQEAVQEQFQPPPTQETAFKITQTEVLDMMRAFRAKIKWVSMTGQQRNGYG